MTARVAVPLLLVDDDLAFRKVYGSLLREAGYEIVEAADRPAARAAFAARPCPVVILDLMLPPDGSVRGGLEMLTTLLAERPGTKVIVASGAGDVGYMLKAVQAGAFDFLTKPLDPDAFLIVVNRAVARVLLEQQVETLQASLTTARPGSSLIGESPAFRAAVELCERVAASDLPVLITGEHGTGKELLARRVHERSPRARRQLLCVNCGALNENLLESTLFGHVRGAFTGAVKDRKGLFAEAGGGTLFLDEIGDMPPALQVKVLRAIELGELLPVGSDAPVHCDVRVVSATNRDLKAMQAAGQFREDLFWRINGAEVRLPPLRERPGDLPLLAAHFLNQCAHLGPDGRPKMLSDEALEALAAHHWPGNLRELRHELQRATVLAGRRAELEAEDFSFHRRPPVGPAAEPRTLPEKVVALERAEITAALAACRGNRSRAAEALGLSRQGLLKKMERYGIE